MRRFLVLLYAATALAQLPMALVVRRVGTHLGWVPPWPIAAVVVCALVLALHGRVKLARWDRPISRARRLLLEEPYLAHWCASFLTPALFLLLLVATLAVGTTTVELVLGCRDGPELACVSSLGDLWLCSYAVALAMGIWAVMVRRRWLRVRRLELPIAGLDLAFDGYRIAQLSDLHVGSMCPRQWLRRWVARVETLDVDLVVLTGDYVTSGVRFHRDVAEELGALHAPDGVFAVMGNHDYFGDGEPLMTLLGEAGVRLLRNQHIEIARAGARICLAGVDDVYTRRIDLGAALAGRDEALPLLVLAHDPVSFDALADRGAALVLSGHTHWGQVRVPWLAPRVGYAPEGLAYRAGIYRRDQAWLYVSPGLGTTGPPARLGTSPEITVITLKAQASP